MFERYNDRGWRTILFARYEAARFGSAEITTEHLMPGLLREDQRLCRLCANLDPEPFREEIAAPIAPAKHFNQQTSPAQRPAAYFSAALVCNECHGKFMERDDFFQSNFSDIT